MSGEIPSSLRCDLTTLHQSERGSITGNLEVEIDKFVFPGAGWSDFVPVVLGWWLEGLHSLIRGQQSVELPFMDGPYLMSVTKEQSGHYTLMCVEDRSDREVTFRACVNPAQVLSEVERTAANVLSVCAEKNCDAEPLRNLYALLKGRRH